MIRKANLLAKNKRKCVRKKFLSCQLSFLLKYAHKPVYENFNRRSQKSGF